MAIASVKQQPFSKGYAGTEFIDTLEFEKCSNSKAQIINAYPVFLWIKLHILLCMVMLVVIRIMYSYNSYT